MSNQRVIGLTGTTGALGGGVLRELRDRPAENSTLRLLARDPTRAPQGYGPVAVAEYGDREAAERALQGVDVLLMVSAGEAEDRLESHRRFVAAAAAAGVRHVVYTSFVGASPTSTFTLARDHAATEELLRDSSMAWTFLRDSFYLDFLAEVGGPEGVIRGPAGDGRVGAVARVDVARSAASVLRHPGDHAGASYDLTGPAALTLREVAAVLTRETGRASSYQPETLAEAHASRAAYGAPPWQLDAWISTWTAIAAGELDLVSDDVRRLTGAEPLSLAELVRQRDAAR